MNHSNNMKNIITLLAVGGGCLLAGCNSGYDNNSNRDRDAAGGAVAGAVIGGIIGHQSGEGTAGAALCAAAGATAGGVYGHQQDQRAGGDYQTQSRDSYGYTSADYYGLLTHEERDTLQSRSRGRQDVDLTSFLTQEEKSNLRRRASGHSEIGR